MEAAHGFTELLIPAVSTVGIGCGHRFSAELIMAHTSYPMPEQCSADFQRNAEILKPGSEGMAEIVEVEVDHLRFHH